MVQPTAPDPGPIVNKEVAAKKTEKGAPDLQNIPKDIQLQILKFFDIKDLGNNILITKLWKMLAADPKRWIELANKLKINITNPTKARDEVIQYYELLKQVNAFLLRRCNTFFPPDIRKMEDPIEANGAMRKFLRDNKKKADVASELASIIDFALSEERFKKYIKSIDKKFVELLRMFCEDGLVEVTPFNLSRWQAVAIYLVGHLNTYKEFINLNYEEGVDAYMSINNFESELNSIITFNSPLEYANFILSKVDKSKRTELLIRVWEHRIVSKKNMDSSFVKLFVDQLRGVNRAEFLKCALKIQESHKYNEYKVALDAAMEQIRSQVLGDSNSSQADAKMQSK